MIKRKRLTPLERVNKAQSYIRAAHDLIKPLVGMIEYVELAKAQLAVAYLNLADYRAYHLSRAPKRLPGGMAIPEHLKGVPKFLPSLAIPEQSASPQQDYLEAESEEVQLVQ